MRVLKKHDPKPTLKKYDLSSLRAALPGRRAARRAHRLAGSLTPWANRSSTTSGKPRPAGRSWPLANGVEKLPSEVRLARACRCTATTSSLLDEATQARTLKERQPKRAWSRSKARLPPGCMQTVWKRRCAFRRAPTGRAVRQPADLQHLRLGHTRRRRLLLHTRPHRRRHQRRRPPPGNARDRGEHLQPPQRRRSGGGRRGRCSLKGQVAMAFVSRSKIQPRRARRSGTRRCKLEAEIMKVVDTTALGAVARPARVRFVATCCPRRARASCCAGRSKRFARGAIAGDLTTIEDPTALEQIRDLVHPAT